MDDTAELLADGFGRVRGVAMAVVEGLPVEQLSLRLLPGRNSIGWLVRHSLTWGHCGSRAAPAASSCSRVSAGRSSRDASLSRAAPPC